MTDECEHKNRNARYCLDCGIVIVPKKHIIKPQCEHADVFRNKDGAKQCLDCGEIVG